MKRITKPLYVFAGAMVMAWLGNKFYDETKNVPVLKWVMAALNWLWHESIFILNYPIKVWWLLVVWLVGSFVYVWRKMNKVIKKANDGPPDYIKYKHDKFRVLLWYWEWKEEDGNWIITKLRPHCPKDGVRLVDEMKIMHTRSCPKCHELYDGYAYETQDEIIPLIEDRINNREYIKA